MEMQSSSLSMSQPNTIGRVKLQIPARPMDRNISLCIERAIIRKTDRISIQYIKNHRDEILKWQCEGFHWSKRQGEGQQGNFTEEHAL
jgi:hypothetical protein